MIVFILVTIALTYIYYEYNQCHGWCDLFECIIMSLLTQVFVASLLYLIITAYLQWLIS